MQSSSSSSPATTELRNCPSAQRVGQKDRAASRIHVVQEPLMRPCEGNKNTERRFVMSDRARDAIGDYLKEARSGGWLANASRLEGPLWISTQPVGTQQRMSRRTAMQQWKTFLEGVPGVSPDYQLDDVVLTGRVAFATAANASPELISEHAGIGTKRRRGTAIICRRGRDRPATS